MILSVIVALGYQQSIWTMRLLWSLQLKNITNNTWHGVQPLSLDFLEVTMSETIFSLEEIAEAFKYIQDDKLSIDAKAMLTMDIGYEKAEKDIIKLLREKAEHHKQISESISMDEYMSESDSESEWWASVVLHKFADALIKGEK